MYKVNSHKLKSKRLAMGLTQVDISEMLFMEQTTYSKIENGKNGLKINTAFKIAEVLQISFEEFIDIPAQPSQKRI